MDLYEWFPLLFPAAFIAAATIAAWRGVERNRDRIEERAERISEELRRERELREGRNTPNRVSPAKLDPLDRPPVPLDWFKLDDVIWLAGVGLLPWAVRIVEELNQYPALGESILKVPPEKHSQVELATGVGSMIITAADEWAVRKLIGFEKK